MLSFYKVVLFGYTIDLYILSFIIYLYVSVLYFLRSREDNFHCFHKNYFHFRWIIPFLKTINYH